MNAYIAMQIKNMELSAKAFASACEMAAKKDDGRIDKTEEKELQKIKRATDRYIKELEKLK